jgi:hypothetical protein
MTAECGAATGESLRRESFCDVDRTCSLSVGARSATRRFHIELDRVHRLEHLHCDVRHWVGLV